MISSFKMNMKTHIGRKLLNNIWKQVKNDKNDVIGFSPSLFNGNYLSETEKFHPGFLELFIPLCNDLGLQVSEPKNIVFSNFFLASRDIYKEFVNTIIKPAISLLESDKYKELAWKDSSYNGLSKEKLQEYSGLEYFPMHTFILERMMSIWLENRKDLKYKQIG